MKKQLQLTHRLVWVLLLVTTFISCDDLAHQPVNTDSSPPKPIASAEVENLPGGARITYKLPAESKGLLYIKAVYEIRPGISREVKASYYTNTLVVDGFGETGEYPVKLIAVGRNNLESDPLSIAVSPLTPPVKSIFETLTVKEDWGGISLTVNNETEASIAIEVITLDSLGDWKPVETFYTKMKDVKFAVRGYEPVKRKFGLYIRDRWDNKSDTITNEYTPLLEEFLDKSKFREMTLPTDYNAPHSGGTLRMLKIWDGLLSESDFVTVPGHGLPQWFTFDLGVTAQLSRLVLFKRLSANFLYNSGAVKKWELWGSANPNPDGSWDDSWILLKECQSIKPSGLPPGQNTNEDLEYAAAGEEFEFSSELPPVRYIRWKTLENWGNVTHVNITEIDVFGQELK